MLHLGFSLNKRLLCYLVTVVGDNDIGDDKNKFTSLTILVVMAMQWYNAGRIAQ